MPIMMPPVCTALADSEILQGNAVDSDSGTTSCYKKILIRTMPEAEPPLSRLRKAIVGGLNNSGTL